MKFTAGEQEDEEADRPQYVHAARIGVLVHLEIELRL
jgi:hypothetical protein